LHAASIEKRAWLCQISAAGFRHRIPEIYPLTSIALRCILFFPLYGHWPYVTGILRLFAACFSICLPFTTSNLRIMNALAIEQSAPISPAPAIAQYKRIENSSIDRILHATRKHLGTEIAFVSRYVENHEKELTHVDSDLELPMGPGFRDSREDSYCWHIYEGRLPQLIQDPADHPFAMTLGITEFLPVGCHLNVPLKLSDGTVYGSFCCLSRKPDRSMGERDLDVLKAFAALAVEQIEGALEHDERRSFLERSISDLIAKNSLQIFHQPIVDLISANAVGSECLARFPDASERGPDRWFNEASEVGLGVDLEMLAFRSALLTQEYAMPSNYLSINASPETIMSGMVVEALARGTSIHNGRRLVVELTEHQKVDDFGALKAAIDQIRPYADLAIDDVGAGYAGLRHLVDLEPDLLKLDMSLTRDIHKDVARQALTAAMVHFAKEIGSKLVAEGIECEEERETLSSLGVDYGQGYLFAKPMPVIGSAQYALGALL
jgi:EAL domain-containing protein (putative c-di-GMP-specific phosphodiesterase class I)